ncbi:hypothetical protein AB1Y20_001141 [Prymnesium parvum]|uniref:PDZ domain-containing protein n=1 Tax=Prymnesium parvum TaxID=97485 RepID=A0AB34K7D4_PRYPA
MVLGLLFGCLACFLRPSIAVGPPIARGPLQIHTAGTWKRPVRVPPRASRSIVAQSDNREADGLSSLSTGELKRLLMDRNVDFRDCLEKQDLVERLKKNLNRPVDRSAPSDLTEGELRRVSVFERCSPAVAFIRTTTSSQPFPWATFEYPSGSGSGFLWDSEGHIVTNYHVIAPQSKVESKVKVSLQGTREQVDAKVVNFDEDCDIAVLKIAVDDLPRPVTVGSSSELKVGQSVLAIGNPFGLDYTLTTGVISALGRDVRGERGVIKGCLQTDAAINPGNSGGPLLDSSGRLIGVNTAIYSTQGGGNIGIGFAVPVDTVRRVVNLIIQQTTVPSMGANVFEDHIAQSIGKKFGLRLEGALVREVVPQGPADAAGLVPVRRGGGVVFVLGDLITAVDNMRVRQVEDLTSAVLGKRPGDTIELTVLRGARLSRTERLKLTLISRDELKKRKQRNDELFSN